MSDRLDLSTRETFRAKIAATVAHVFARASDRTAEAVAAEIAAELKADADEMAVLGLQIGLSAALGPEMGAAAYADLSGTLAESDAEVARRFGVTPAAVGKIFRRIRKNLGLPLRVPSNARTKSNPRTGGAS
jgi:hypothetical protein